MWNSPLITLSLHLRGRVVTKGRQVIIFAKSQAPFDEHRQYLDVFLIDSQARVSRFWLSNFSLFCWFLENLAQLSSVFIFKKLSAHDFLAFRVTGKQACRLDFSIRFPKTVFLRWNLYRKVNFLHGYDMYIFSWFLLLSIYKKTSESIRLFCRNNPTWVNNLKGFHLRKLRLCEY